MTVLGSNPSDLLNYYPEAYDALPDRYKADRLLLFRVIKGELYATLDTGSNWHYNDKLKVWEPWSKKR